MANRQKAVFLDRDGTLNIDPGYLNDPKKVCFYDGVVEALSRLKKEGFFLVIVSNQSGINRGLIRPEQLEAIHSRFNEILSPFSAQIDAFCFCPHTPEENCTCRKPKPKLILDAADRFLLDLSQSVMIGDRLTDLEAGTAAGVAATILVRTGVGQQTEEQVPSDAYDFVANDLQDAVRWLLEV